MKKLIPLLLAFFCSATLLLAQSPGQTLRGTVTDADNHSPIFGASIQLLPTNPAIGTTTNESGSYVIEKLPVGRYRVQVAHLGYETLIIAELLVESGRETVLNVQLRERADSLQAVIVKASSLSNSSDAPINRLNFSVEEQFRFPTTNFDPARLAMSYPGVVGENDGTNIISVRGNSPNALQWRLEGVEIVNPNHTANAGTFGDRPTGAGGGVNILSAQLLGSSSMLTGAFPAQYGNAIGGIMDMNFRSGNDQHHELIAQAGFIGIEAAAEGPLTGDRGQRTVDGQSPITNHQSPSFLVNYRYSFTGLLTAMGADFGDEETAYQDVAFHVALPGKKGGKLSFFGMGGKSYTLYRSPTDSATIEKELFNIDFNSKMGAAGLTYVKPFGKRSVWRTVAVLSALEHVRTADLVVTQSPTKHPQEDELKQQKSSLSSVFSHKINAQQRWKAGFEATYFNDSFYSNYNNQKVNYIDDGHIPGTLLQPYFDWDAQLGGNWEISAGLHGTINSSYINRLLLEPRFTANYDAGAGKFGISYGLHSQSLPVQIRSIDEWEEEAPIRAHHFMARYQLEIPNAIIFKVETYFQKLFKVPIYDVEGSTFSTINFSDFSQSYLGPLQDSGPIFFSNHGKGRNYGLDISLQKYLTDRFFFLLAGSLYKSEYAVNDGNFRSTRFDGRHALNLTAGRELAKQKNGKTIISGISGRAAWLGGFRDTPIDEATSAEVGYTVYQQDLSFTEKLEDNFRIDLRLYRKWNKIGKNSMLSLDIQNLTNRENAQYHYFDTVQGKVLLKRQLGLIPILTWRGEF